MKHITQEDFAVLVKNIKIDEEGFDKEDFKEFIE